MPTLVLRTLPLTISVPYLQVLIRPVSGHGQPSLHEDGSSGVAGARRDRNPSLTPTAWAALDCKEELRLLVLYKELAQKRFGRVYCSC